MKNKTPKDNALKYNVGLKLIQRRNLQKQVLIFDCLTIRTKNYNMRIIILKASLINQSIHYQKGILNHIINNDDYSRRKCLPGKG